MSVRIQNLRLIFSLTRAATAAMAVILTLGGCTSLSGLGGESKYACKAPVGVTCDSVSGTYANAIHNNLPGQRQQHSTDAAALSSTAQPTASRHPPLAPAPAVAPSNTGTPTGISALRSQSRVMRLWTKPWEDADGDLYDQGYVYVQVDAGQWLIDHVQRQIRDAYAPLRPPPKASADATSDGGQGSDGATGLSPSSRPTSPNTPFPPRGAPSAVTPSGTSFNRTQ